MVDCALPGGSDDFIRVGIRRAGNSSDPATVQLELSSQLQRFCHPCCWTKAGWRTVSGGKLALQRGWVCLNQNRAKNLDKVNNIEFPSKLENYK